MWKVAALVVVGLSCAGCATLPGDETALIDGERIELSQLTGVSPAIVFEAGLGSYKEVWNKVFSAFQGTNAALAYNRPGVGGSNATPRPRDGATIVEDLRRLLRVRGLTPPYVLVGHSSGGLYMQLYAREYPGEVAGLVLVDSTHPTQFEGQGAMANRGALANAALAVALNATAKAEFVALEQTGHEVLAAEPPRADLPIIILSALDRSGTSTAAWDNAKRSDLLKLYPGAKLIAVEGGHDVPEEQSRAVVDAIRYVLSEYRNRREASARLQ